MTGSKNRKTFSIRWKIAFFMVSLVIVIMGAVTYIFTIRELNMRADQMKLRMQHLADNIASIRSVETEDWDIYQIYLDNQIKINPDIVYILMKDEHGAVRASVLNDAWIELDPGAALSDSLRANIVQQLDAGRIAEESRQDIATKSKFIIMGERNVGMVKVGFSLVDLNNEKRYYLYRNFNYALVFVFLAIIVALVISQRIVSSLATLNRAMLRISEGDLNQMLAIDSRDEIGEMAETFNFMAKGLREKRVIEEFTRELGFTVKPEEIELIIIEWIVGAMDAESGVLLLIAERNGESFLQSRMWVPAQTDETLDIILSEELSRLLLSAKDPVPMASLKKKGVLSGVKHLLVDDGFAMVSPIIVNEELLGCIIVSGKSARTVYSKDEMSFFMTLVRQSGFAIENAHLLTELTRQERLKRELEIGRTVQQSLLPAEKPTVPGLDIDGTCLPATQVGGDYFDYFPLDDHTFGITIADVSGKGVSAAFYMAVVKGMMSSLTQIERSPARLLAELNKRLFQFMHRNMFITMSYAVIDMQKKQLLYARAGHNALIYFDAKSRTSESLTPAGLGLGLAEDTLFAKVIAEKTISFKKNDVFIFYTDGISEAMNGDKVVFSEEKLESYPEKCRNLGAVELRQKIIHDVRGFTGEAPQHDDMTIIVLKACN